MVDDTERQLGILIGKTQAIADRLDAAAIERAELRSSVRSVSDGMIELQSTVGTLSTDVAEMKPEVALVRGIKAKAGGAALVLGAIGAILSWMIAYFWEVIVDTLFGAAG